LPPGRPADPPDPPVPFSTLHPLGKSERTSRCFFACATLDDVAAPAGAPTADRNSPMALAATPIPSISRLALGHPPPAIDGLLVSWPFTIRCRRRLLLLESPVRGYCKRPLSGICCRQHRERNHAPDGEDHAP